MKRLKLDTRGFSHDLVLIAIVAIFAIGGVGFLVASHAAVNGGGGSTNCKTTRVLDGKPVCDPVSGATSGPVSEPTKKTDPPKTDPPVTPIPAKSSSGSSSSTAKPAAAAPPSSTAKTPAPAPTPVNPPKNSVSPSITPPANQPQTQTASTAQPTNQQPAPAPKRNIIQKTFNAIGHLLSGLRYAF